MIEPLESNFYDIEWLCTSHNCVKTTFNHARISFVTSLAVPWLPFVLIEMTFKRNITHFQLWIPWPISLKIYASFQNWNNNSESGYEKEIYFQFPGNRDWITNVHVKSTLGSDWQLFTGL